MKLTDYELNIIKNSKDESIRKIYLEFNKYQLNIKEVGEKINIINNLLKEHNKIVSISGNTLVFKDLITHKESIYYGKISEMIVGSKILLDKIFKLVNKEIFYDIMTAINYYNVNLNLLHKQWLCYFYNTPEYTSLINRFNEICYFFNKNQDYNKIRQNMLSGKKYAKITIGLQSEEGNVYLSLIRKVSLFSLNNFNQINNTISIYVPFVKDGKMKDYINKYEELNVFSYKEIGLYYSIFSIEKNNQILNNVSCDMHDVKKLKNPLFKEQYNIIEKFLNKNKDTKNLADSVFYLEFDVKNKQIYFKSIELKKISILELENFYYINEKNKNLFSHLIIDNEKNVIDIEKTVDFINTLNNIENF